MTAAGRRARTHSSRSSAASTWCSTPRRTGEPVRSPWRSDVRSRERPSATGGGVARSPVKVTFLSPHLRVAGGVRAILTHADRLATRGHDVTVVVPARRRAKAWWRNRVQRVPDWMPGLRARVRWVTDWAPDRLPDGDALIATAWQSAAPVADAPARCGR